jgi:hypothetical protein
MQLLATVTAIAVLLAAATVLQDNESPVVIHAGSVMDDMPPPAPGALDWIIIGGGGTPADNQVTIEGDVIDAARTLGGAGRALFSGGSNTACVQVLDREMPNDPLLRDLGGFFAPRAGRRSWYRAPKIASTPATAGAVLHLLGNQLARKEAGSLLVYAAGHGEIGNAARDNFISLWAGSQLSVADLADALDRGGSGRTVRVVATTCFSGGFGELVFRAADDQRGAARTARCGLFASPWDLESSGCDPDPDRRRHHGFGAYFLPALRAKTRTGERLTRDDIDFDGDDRISLLEAHARVRIASPTADVPTTTSERWLRHAAPLSGPVSPVNMPEDEAVIVAVGRRLGVAEPMTKAKSLFEQAEKSSELTNAAVKTEHAAEDDAYHAVAAAMLGRWPVLDDPWHPKFRELVREERTEIADFIASSPLWRRWTRAVSSTDKATARRHAVRKERAMVERLHRAVQNVELAGRLTARGGPDWLYFKQLMRCERYVPKLAETAKIRP